MQTRPQPLEQHFWPSEQTLSSSHMLTQAPSIPSPSLVLTGQVPGRTTDERNKDITGCTKLYKTLLVKGLGGDGGIEKKVLGEGVIVKLLMPWWYERHSDLVN